VRALGPGTFVRRSRRDEGGAAATEFALVLPLLVFVLMMMVAVGSLLIQYQQLVAAAREGARYAALTQSTVGTVQATTLAAVTSTAFSVGPNVSVASWPAGASGWSGSLGPTERPCNQVSAETSRVRVTVTATVTPSAPFLALVPIPMSASGVFRCE
jgi:Flp pilus assembly protein TadG